MFKHMNNKHVERYCVKIIFNVLHNSVDRPESVMMTEAVVRQCVHFRRAWKFLSIFQVFFRELLRNFDRTSLPYIQNVRTQLGTVSCLRLPKLSGIKRLQNEIQRKLLQSTGVFPNQLHKPPPQTNYQLTYTYHQCIILRLLLCISFINRDLRIQVCSRSFVNIMIDTILIYATLLSRISKKHTRRKKCTTKLWYGEHLLSRVVQGTVLRVLSIPKFRQMLFCSSLGVLRSLKLDQNLKTKFEEMKLLDFGSRASPELG